jgi:hypothetical protein
MRRTSSHAKRGSRDCEKQSEAGHETMYLMPTLITGHLAIWSCFCRSNNVGEQGGALSEAQRRAHAHQRAYTLSLRTLFLRSTIDRAHHTPCSGCNSCSYRCSGCNRLFYSSYVALTFIATYCCSRAFPKDTVSIQSRRNRWAIGLWCVGGSRPQVVPHQHVRHYG